MRRASRRAERPGPGLRGTEARVAGRFVTLVQVLGKSAFAGSSTSWAPAGNRVDEPLAPSLCFGSP